MENRVEKELLWSPCVALVFVNIIKSNFFLNIETFLSDFFYNNLYVVQISSYQIKYVTYSY